MAVNFDLVSYLYIFRSIPNGFWSQSKKFDMLMLSVKRDLLNSVPRIKFKMFLQGFLCFKVLSIFSKKSIFNLNCVSAFWPWTYFRACYAKKCIQNQAWKISADFVCSKVLCGFFLKLNFEQNNFSFFPNVFCSYSTKFGKIVFSRFWGILCQPVQPESN